MNLKKKGEKVRSFFCFQVVISATSAKKKKTQMKATKERAELLSN